MDITKPNNTLRLTALALPLALLTACGGGGGGSNPGGGGGGSNPLDPILDKACEGGTTCGNLDEVQGVIDDVLAGTVGTVLPDPVGPVVECASDAVNNVIDVPDALLVGLENLAATQDPTALLLAFNDMGASFGNAAHNVQGMLTSIAGTDGACDINGGTAAGLPELPGFPGLPDTGSGDGPTGTPLDLALAPLVDGLNTLVDTLDGAAAGTPAAPAIDPIVTGLDALLAVLNNGGAGEIPQLPALPGGGDNPLQGTLTMLQNELAGLAQLQLDPSTLPTSLPSIPGLPGLPATPGGDNLDLSPLTDVLASVTEAVGMAVAQGRAELENAAGSDVPVIGGVLLTVETAMGDTAVLLDNVATYNGAGTNAALESLLENTLDNALTQVIPLEMIGDQAGQDIATPVRDGIAQGVSAIGDGTEPVVDILFANVLNGAAAPALDPIEAVLAQLLAASPIGLDDLLGGGIDQFVAALTDLTGGGLPGAGDLPGLPGLPGAGDNPLDALLGGLPALGGDLPSGDGPTGTPLDLLLGALIDNDPSGQLSGLLGQISGPLTGLLAQLQALAP